MMIMVLFLVQRMESSMAYPKSYRTSIKRLIVLSGLLMIVGCVPTVTGYVWTVNAYIPPQPLDSVRAQFLALGGFEGPLKITGSSLCIDGKYYDKWLKHSGKKLSVYDCLTKRTDSETGWLYFVSVATAIFPLEPDAQKETVALVNDIRKIVKDSVGNARITSTEREITRGFSFLPY